MLRSPKSSAAEGAPAAREGGRLWFVMILCAAGFVGVAAPAVAEKAVGQLSLRDAVAVAGKSVRIEARLVQAGLLNRSGVGGEQLELVIGKRKVGQAMTGGDGRAFFEQVCRKRGSQTMTVRLASQRRVESPEAVGTLACWERRRPILLVDLATLVKTDPRAFPAPGLPLPLTRGAPEPEADAADELKRLTEYFFNVIYLAWAGAAPAETPEDWQAWLRSQRFPLGPVVPVDPGPAGLEALLDHLKSEGWENVKTGIGRTKAFAETFINRRMEVVIVPGQQQDETLPRRARVAKDWKELRKKLRS